MTKPAWCQVDNVQEKEAEAANVAYDGDEVGINKRVASIARASPRPANEISIATAPGNCEASSRK